MSQEDQGFQAGVLQRFRESLALLEAQGAEIVEVSAPSFEYAIDAYYLILPAEASSTVRVTGPTWSSDDASAMAP